MTSKVKKEDLYVGWTGSYTVKGGEKHFGCTVIAFDGDEPVIKTKKGHYHRRPLGPYVFINEDGE